MLVPQLILKEQYCHDEDTGVPANAVSHQPRQDAQHISSTGTQKSQDAEKPTQPETYKKETE